MAAPARKGGLRAVKAGEKAAKQTVEQAAASGDHLALLVAMRERIAETVASMDCPPRDLASLTRRLQDISKEIEAIKLKKTQEAAEDGIEASGDEWDEEAI